MSQITISVQGLEITGEIEDVFAAIERIRVWNAQQTATPAPTPPPVTTENVGAISAADAIAAKFTISDGQPVAPQETGLHATRQTEQMVRKWAREEAARVKGLV